MALIEAADVGYTFPDGTRALSGVSFTVSEGEFVVISGKNGSGKTLLLRIMNGLLRPTEGEIRVDGLNTARHPAKVRERLGLVFQLADHQIVGETVSRDIAFGLENLRIPKEERSARIRQALERVDLADHADQRPRTLSGGEKRRLTIAGTYAMQPRVIALDEPFTNLDYPGVLQVLRLLVDLHREGHTIIVVTHDLDKVLAHADRLILMDRGSITADGTPQEAAATAPSCGVRLPKDFSAEKIGEYTWLKD